MKKYKTAQHAFEDLFNKVIKRGKSVSGTKAIYNCGFYIENPQDNIILTPWRKFNPTYAEYEWQWYLSGNRNADDIAKRAPIWAQMQDEDGNVNSNYGYQWNRNQQLEFAVSELENNPLSRRAVISIYDGKEHHLHAKDTPCTLSITFFIVDGCLEMSVNMRSNDLVFGFCNDQYCFSELQKIVAQRLNIKVGGYYHFAVNMHIYERHWTMNSTSKCKNCGNPLVGRSDKQSCSTKCRTAHLYKMKNK
jgi:thymidylate synthase